MSLSKTQYSKEVEKNIDNYTRIIEKTLNKNYWANVSLKNPLVLDFYKALKRQKVFGAFCAAFKMKELSYIEKKVALRVVDLVFPIGNLDILERTLFSDRNEPTFGFLERIGILNAMTQSIPSEQSKLIDSKMTRPKALGYYAKEYFKDKQFPIKHTAIYYQLLFGILNVIIGLIMILGLIYYIWGWIGLTIVSSALLTYSCIVIPKLRFFNKKYFGI